MAKVEQIELYKTNEPRPRPMREPASLEMKGPTETFRKEIIHETKGPHVCEMCRQVIPTGSRAVRIITIEKGKANYDKIDYFHFKKDCPEYQNF